MSTPTISGITRFHIEGQSAYPKWAQQAIQNALDTGDTPPESLRYQCRIATDARENFKEIRLAGGETLRLHPKSNPQFGKNRRGHAYLTATMIYSGDGATYTVRWEGDAVPSKMQEVAVKHDKGLAVKPAIVALDLGKATVSRSMSKVYNQRYAANKPASVDASRRKYEAKAKEKRGKRNCERVGASDLTRKKAVAA